MWYTNGTMNISLDQKTISYIKSLSVIFSKKFNHIQSCDLEQEGYLAAYKALEKWDSERCAMFSYVYNPVKWAMRDYIARNVCDVRNKSRGQAMSHISRYNMESGEEADITEVLESPVNPVSLRFNELLETIDGKITPKQKELLNWVYEGYTNQEIAKKINKSPTLVDKMKKDLYKQIKMLYTESSL